MWTSDLLVGQATTREDFIHAMRRVASSVTVVTTEGAGGRHGATVSAFTSVSADPPSVLICLKADSKISKFVSANGIFCVNVLPQLQTDTAARFAGFIDAELEDRFEGIKCISVPGLPPLLDGATAFACELRQSVDHGSHRVFIGDVMHVLEQSSDPLVYMDGGYRRVTTSDDTTG